MTVNFGIDTVGVMGSTDDDAFVIEGRCILETRETKKTGPYEPTYIPELYTDTWGKTYEGDCATLWTPNYRLSIAPDPNFYRTGNRSNFHITFDAGAFASDNVNLLTPSRLIRVPKLIREDLAQRGCHTPDLTGNKTKIFRVDLALNLKLQHPFDHYMPALEAARMRRRRRTDKYKGTTYYLGPQSPDRQWDIILYDKYSQMVKKAKKEKLPPPAQHLKNVVRCEVRSLKVAHVDKFLGVTNLQELRAIAADWLPLHQGKIKNEIHRHQPNFNLPASSPNGLLDLEALVASPWEGEKSRSYRNFESMVGRHYMLKTHGLPYMESFIEEQFCDTNNQSSVKTLRTICKELEETNLSLALTNNTPSGSSLADLYRELQKGLTGS
jgi:hypothetical protein